MKIQWPSVCQQALSRDLGPIAEPQPGVELGELVGAARMFAVTTR